MSRSYYQLSSIKGKAAKIQNSKEAGEAGKHSVGKWLYQEKPWGMHRGVSEPALTQNFHQVSFLL